MILRQEKVSDINWKVCKLFEIRQETLLLIHIFQKVISPRSNFLWGPFL